MMLVPTAIGATFCVVASLLAAQSWRTGFYRIQPASFAASIGCALLAGGVTVLALREYVASQLIK